MLNSPEPVRLRAARPSLRRRVAVLPPPFVQRSRPREERQRSAYSVLKNTSISLCVKRTHRVGVASNLENVLATKRE